MRVEQFYNKNQFIIRGEGKTVFQSYNSTIAEIDKNGQLTLGIDWDYSNTTSKHLYLFLEDYYYSFNSEIQSCIYNIRSKTNKRAYIQKLINNGTIKYNENLR